MNKLDFLNRLRAALTGRLTAEQIQEHLNYYEDYINTQVRLGQTEEAVLMTLGDPRLLAKTIINASEVEAGENTDSYYGGYYNSNIQNRGNGYVKERRTFRIPGWLWAIIIIFILLMVLGLVFTLLSALAPLICVILVVVGLMKFFDWLN
uniref:DUF1700 domain-containing protein n=1 Tax=Acetatifactor sp. TaxID=1872090 RepID=UPI00405683F8